MTFESPNSRALKGVAQNSYGRHRSWSLASWIPFSILRTATKNVLMHSSWQRNEPKWFSAQHIVAEKHFRSLRVTTNQIKASWCPGRPDVLRTYPNRSVSSGISPAFENTWANCRFSHMAFASSWKIDIAAFTQPTSKAIDWTVVYVSKNSVLFFSVPTAPMHECQPSTAWSLFFEFLLFGIAF